MIIKSEVVIPVSYTHLDVYKRQFVVSDTLSTMVPFTSFRLVSNTGVDGTPVLSFDADHLYVNWENLGFGGGELVFTVSPVPEPETLSLIHI